MWDCGPYGNICSYIKEADQQLSDKARCKQLTQDPT